MEVQKNDQEIIEHNGTQEALVEQGHANEQQ